MFEIEIADLFMQPRELEKMIYCLSIMLDWSKRSKVFGLLTLLPLPDRSAQTGSFVFFPVRGTIITFCLINMWPQVVVKAAAAVGSWNSGRGEMISVVQSRRERRFGQQLVGGTSHGASLSPCFWRCCRNRHIMLRVGAARITIYIIFCLCAP